MRVVFFVHSLLSDWNHGNAHFLRGVATELVARGYTVDVYEPEDAWSARHLVADRGEAALQAMRNVYPSLHPIRYAESRLDLDEALQAADVVVVHEWNSHELVARIGEHHRRWGDYVLLFHDTHHRSVTEPHQMAAYDLSAFDGVLAFGEVVRRRYLEFGWASRAWTWHEAADTRLFRSESDYNRGLTLNVQISDVVWVGNWGDDERAEELTEFLVEPIRRLGLTATVYGVRYPADALAALRRAGIAYGGWLPNFRVPGVFARHRVTIHVPRRPYAESLPGIPTIRPFEALACGIPLISAPWNDAERLFRPGADYLIARNGAEMERHLRDLLNDPLRATALAASGRRTILARHTCAHRVDELLAIVADLRRVPRASQDALTT